MTSHFCLKFVIKPAVITFAIVLLSGIVWCFPDREGA